MTSLRRRLYSGLLLISFRSRGLSIFTVADFPWVAYLRAYDRTSVYVLRNIPLACFSDTFQPTRLSFGDRDRTLAYAELITLVRKHHSI